MNGRHDAATGCPTLEFVDEVDRLEAEHVALDTAIAELDPQDPDFVGIVRALLSDLAEHVERENLGIFPVAVVTLGADGWNAVEQARLDHPTFLGDSGEASVSR